MRVGVLSLAKVEIIKREMRYYVDIVLLLGGCVCMCVRVLCACLCVRESARARERERAERTVLMVAHEHMQNASRYARGMRRQPESLLQNKFGMNHPFAFTISDDRLAQSTARGNCYYSCCLSP